MWYQSGLVGAPRLGGEHVEGVTLEPASTSGFSRFFPDLAPVVVSSTTGRTGEPSADLAVIGTELLDDATG